jgi:hypothetical protein
MRQTELRITDSLVSTVAAGSPPVSALTLDYAKQHIRALGSVDDVLTTVYINAAASYFEEQTGRQLLTATREAWLDAFPFVGASGMRARIELPRPPLQKVLDVRYVDATTGAWHSSLGGSPAATTRGGGLSSRSTGRAGRGRRPRRRPCAFRIPAATAHR